MVEIPYPLDNAQACLVYFTMLQRGEVTLARFAGEGRGEGLACVAPLPYPSPPRRRGGEGILLVGFEPTIIEPPQLLAEGCFMIPTIPGIGRTI
jgi:hypothetical protein